MLSQSYNLIEETNLISLFIMNTIYTAKEIATLAAIFSQYSYTLDKFYQSSGIIVSVDDAAYLAAESYKNILEISNDNTKIVEMLREQIFEFDSSDGTVLRIDNNEAAIIERVNALIAYLHDGEDIADCTDIIKSNENIIKGLYDFFNFETDLEVTIIESCDNNHIVIAFVLN